MKKDKTWTDKETKELTKFGRQFRKIVDKIGGKADGSNSEIMNRRLYICKTYMEELAKIGAEINDKKWNDQLAIGSLEKVKATFLNKNPFDELFG